ncbi:MAG TPA: LLM class F420-dependent oxidoreductase [Candidatus Dormibacteraeota bacterium]|nr:LLM class F420-dependent oxidoreductase [Candidatus Dormibacteraeota bacterium]
MRLLFGFHMPNYTYHGVPADGLFDRVVEMARAAEAADFDLVTVMDHFYQIPGVGPEENAMLECYSTLAALAVSTSRVKLGTLVTGVTYRNPALLAKMVTTLDVISKGRAVLGLGAAWNEAEHAGYGIAFPPIGERMDRLDEALTICKLMFTEERPSFEGKHYRIERALNSPRPIQAGGPQILVGGTGERRTLRIAAQHADITHWFGASVADLKHKLEVFERHCEAVDRDSSTVVKTIGAGLVLAATEKEAQALLDRVPSERRSTLRAVTPEQAAEFLRPYIDAGFTGFTFNNPMLPTPESVSVAGEVIRLLR